MAACGIFAKHVCEIALDKYVDNIHNISNDDRQKQIARIISPCTYRFLHLDSENEVRLNPIIFYFSLLTNKVPKIIFLHQSLSLIIAKTFFDHGSCNFTRCPDTNSFTQELTHRCLLLAASAVKYSLDNWAAGRFLYMLFEADIYKGT